MFRVAVAEFAGSAVRLLRLAWSPRALPHAALNVAVLGGIKGGFVGWFLLAGLFFAPFGATDHTFRTWSDWTISVAATFVTCGFIGSIIVMTLILLLVPIAEDETSLAGRAALNCWLMVPYCALIPMAAWAFLAATTHPRVDVWTGPPPWARWAIVRSLASSLWLVPIAASMVGLTGWARRVVRRRLASGDCIGCGYPLTGLAEPRCPECGRFALPGQRIGPAPARP